MVASRNRHILGGTRNRADVRDQVRRGPLRQVRVAVELSRVTAVGIGDPRVVGLIETAVHIVPAGIHKHAVIVHARLPLVGLMGTQADDVGTVLEHRMQRKSRDLSPMAPSIAATPFGYEGDPAVGKPAGIEVVNLAVRQLDQSRTVRAAPEDMEDRRVVPNPNLRVAVGIGEQDLTAVKRHIGSEIAAVPEFLAFPSTGLDDRVLKEIPGLRRIRPRVLQHIQSVFPRQPVRRGVKPEELVAHVHAPIQFIRRERLAGDEKDLADRLQERVRERDLAAQHKRFAEQGIPPRRLRHRRLPDAPLQLRQPAPRIRQSRDLPIKVVIQSAYPPSHHIQRIAVRR